MKAAFKFIQICCLICAAFVLEGSGAIASGLGRTVRTFPDFLAVVAKEGDTFSSLSQEYLNDPSWDWFIAEWNETGSLRAGQTVIIPLKPDRRGGLTLRGYQTVPVLAYHNISPGKSDKMTVNQEMFEQQMGLLKEKGYRVVSMDQLFDFLEFKGSIPPKSVVITIDDGWLSVYEIVLPILKKYGYPATLFIYTDVIGRGSKTVSWPQLLEMTAQGIAVQVHTMSHRNLAHPEEKESFKGYFENLERELSGSREIIKKKLNLEAKYLAYPYGDTTSLVVELAKKLGYRGALTIKRGGNPFFIHNYRVNRSVIYGDFNLNHFERNLAIFQEQSLK
jgi:peptidoglycan/xylan/chitin deacetylase (PgdA/CDA1 family)